MARETLKQQKENEKQEAINRLRSILQPGDRVYGIVKHVSRSGMSRNIDFYTFKQRDSLCNICNKPIDYHLHSRSEDCPDCKAPQDHHDFEPGRPEGPIDHIYLSGWIAKASGDYRRDKWGALVVPGCGQDMIFATVYNVAIVIFQPLIGLTPEEAGIAPELLRRNGEIPCKISLGDIGYLLKSEQL